MATTGVEMFARGLRAPLVCSALLSVLVISSGGPLAPDARIVPTPEAPPEVEQSPSLGVEQSPSLGVQQSPSPVGKPQLVLNLGGPQLGIPFDASPVLSDDFGEVQIGATGRSHIIDVNNPLTYPVMITKITVTRVSIGDPDSSDARSSDRPSFLLAEDRCTGTTLTPAGSSHCALGILFKPKQIGPEKAEVVLGLTRICGSVRCGEAPAAENVKGDAAADWNKVLVVKGVGTM